MAGSKAGTVEEYLEELPLEVTGKVAVAQAVVEFIEAYEKARKRRLNPGP